MLTDAAPVLSVPDFMATRIHQGGSDIAPCGESIAHGVVVVECEDLDLCERCMAHVGRLTVWVRA